MIGNAGSLKISIEVDDRGSAKLRNLGDIAQAAAKKGEQGFAVMRTSLNDLDQSSKVTLGTLKNIGIAAAAMTTAVAVAVTTGMMKSVEAASNLAETTSKFNVVFAGQAEKANAWATELVNNYAMSTREARQYLGSVQDLLVPMGMQADAAGEMSNQVVKLSADLGSFNNLPTAQVMDDIQSALVGNYETMKKYGVVLNATTVEEKAMAMGLAKTKEELTAGMKAQAAYALMVAGSQAAIGDMARTADGYANQLKKFHAQIEDLTAGFGQRMLSVAADALSKINVALGGSAGGVDALAQALSMRLLAALKFVVQTVQFLHNGFNGLVLVGQTVINAYSMVFDYLATGLRTVLTPLDLLFQGLVKLGQIDVNPFDALASSAVTFRQSAGQVLDEQIKKVLETNAAYDKVISTIDGYITQTKNFKATEDAKTNAASASTSAVAANAEALDQSTTALEDGSTQRKAAAQQAAAFTEAIQQSSVYMGEEALAYEKSSDGMYGYKTAMQLAYETTNSMDGTVTGLTGNQDLLRESTDGLAGSYQGLTTATYQATAALAAYQAKAALSPPAERYNLPPTAPPPTEGALTPNNQSPIVITNSTPNKTINTTTINIHQQLSRSDVIAIQSEMQRRGARV